jgi:quercetin dioxygenase-like cupin family protein
MTAYTIHSLDDSQDMAPKFGFGELGEARFARSDLAAEQTGVSLLRLNPGARQAFGHHHDEAEEVYVVLKGSGRVKLDDDIVEISRLDAIRVAPTVVRAFEAGPDGLEWLAFGAHHEGDGALVHEWWTD